MNPSTANQSRAIRRAIGWQWFQRGESDKKVFYNRETGGVFGTRERLLGLWEHDFELGLVD